MNILGRSNSMQRTMKDKSSVYASLGTLESLVAELQSIDRPREELLVDARHETAAKQALATQAQALVVHVTVLSRELSVSEATACEMARAAKLSDGQLDWAQEELERMEAKLEGAEAQVGGLREQLASLATERAQLEGRQQQIIEQAERDVEAARAGAAAAVTDAGKKLQEAQSASAAAGIGPSRAAEDASARLIARAEGEATRASGLEAQLAASRRHASELEAELQRRDDELHALKSARPAGSAEAEARHEAEALAQDLFARERESLRAAAAEIAGRETRLLDSQEILAAELAELQGVLAAQEPHGDALVRLSQERQQAHGELGSAKRRVRELEEETMRLQADCDRLRVRNATLLERERRRRQALGE